MPAALTEVAGAALTAVVVVVGVAMVDGVMIASIEKLSGFCPVVVIAATVVFCTVGVLTVKVVSCGCAGAAAGGAEPALLGLFRLRARLAGVPDGGLLPGAGGGLCCQ